MSCAAPVYAVRAKSASSAHTLVVAASRQGAYPTIQAAVDAARNGDTIRILPGVYHEAVDMKNKTLYLDGVSRDACILTWSGRDYSEPPLEISTGTVSNLTIHATADGTPGLVPGGYCLHADFDPELGGTLVIDNVNFINDVTTAVGIATFHSGDPELPDRDARGCAGLLHARLGDGRSGCGYGRAGPVSGKLCDPKQLF